MEKISQIIAQRVTVKRPQTFRHDGVWTLGLYRRYEGNVNATQKLKLEVIRHIDEVLYVEVKGISQTKLPLAGERDSSHSA